MLEGLNALCTGNRGLSRVHQIRKVAPVCSKYSLEKCTGCLIQALQAGAPSAPQAGRYPHHTILAFPPCQWDVGLWGRDGARRGEVKQETQVCAVCPVEWGCPTPPAQGCLQSGHAGQVAASRDRLAPGVVWKLITSRAVLSCSLTAWSCACRKGASGRRWNRSWILLSTTGGPKMCCGGWKDGGYFCKVMLFFCCCCSFYLPVKQTFSSFSLWWEKQVQRKSKLS